MTSHGFGMCKLKSSRITPDHIAEFARRVSEVKAIIKAHVVSCETRRYDIMFEFDHLVKYHMTPADLLKELRKIDVDGHRIGELADFCVIQSSYHSGKLLPEDKERRI